MKSQNNEIISPKGTYRIFEIPLNKVTKLLCDIGDIAGLLKHSEKTQCFENIIPTVGRASLATNLVTLGGSLPAANELRISYIAVGTSATAVSAADTQLNTEVYRKSVDSQVVDSTAGKSTILIDYSAANGNTLREVGSFAGSASGTANSGTIMSHALFASPIVKDISKIVVIEISINFA